MYLSNKPRQKDVLLICRILQGPVRTSDSSEYKKSVTSLKILTHEGGYWKRVSLAAKREKEQLADGNHSRDKTEGYINAAG